MQTTMTRLCALAAALSGIALAGCLIPKDLEPGAEDRRAIVTIEDFAGWLEGISIELAPQTETFTKRKIALSYELSYEFSGVQAGSGADSLRVFVHSEVVVHSNTVSALHNANTYWVGLKAGLWKNGASLERVDPTLDWGDRIDCFKIEIEGSQVGNLFIGQSGRIATYVMVTGLYSSDPAMFEALLEPKLRALEHYDPESASRVVAHQQVTDGQAAPTPTESMADCTLAAGYVLGDVDALEFGVSIYRCPDSWKLDFEEFRGYAPDGDVQWHVLDALRLPDVSSDETVVSQTCSLSDSPDERIVAIAKQTDEDDFSGIRAAWRADTQHARWARVDAASVSCWNEAAGAS